MSAEDAARREQIVAAVRAIAGAGEDGTPGVQEYDHHRREHDPELPAITTVYRLFPSWGAVLEQAGLASHDRGERRRTSRDDLLDALRHVAAKLGVSVLSSHAYDDYRIRSAEKLPSSSVIRKWLGSWEQAVCEAGLSAPRRAGVRRASAGEVIESIRRAIRDLGPDMEPRAYEIWARERIAGGEDTPRLQQVLANFPTFELAVRASDVERDDDIHPHALWTSEEARRILRTVSRVLGHSPDRESYERLRRAATRPMPSWHVLTELTGDSG